MPAKENLRMRCPICEAGCELSEHNSGRCGMYRVVDGRVQERLPHRYLSTFPVSLETVPLLHFAPRGTYLQVCTVGCNFTCPGCISEVLTLNVETLSGALKKHSPQDLVEHARDAGCRGIVFCLNEPAVSFFTFKELIATAHAAGLETGCSTNAYFSAAALAELIPHLDFVNIGLKGSSAASYRACGVNDAGPVLRNLRTLHTNGVHVEVSCLYLKGGEAEVRETARAVSDVAAEIPFQVMRFMPFGDAPLALEPTIEQSERLCTDLRGILPYVYLFNSPGTDQLNTVCPCCGRTIISREFYGPMGARVLEARPGACCSCGFQMPLKHEIAPQQFHEPGFFGGYRSTRAMEMVAAILRCLEVAPHTRAALWPELLTEKFLSAFHHDIQEIDSYLQVVTDLARRTETVSRGAQLTAYIEAKVSAVAQATATLPRPRVYYCMGYPLFALNAERFENSLVEAAGGLSLNRAIEREGKPGVTLSPEEITAMNPEVICISGFLSIPVSDAERYCTKHGLDIPALTNRTIFAMPPSWDFGSPRWVLGLLYLANKLYPAHCTFDIQAEADQFYRTFYGIPFDPAAINRSFHRPGTGAGQS